VSYSETPSTNAVWAVPCFAFCRLPLQFSALIFFVVSLSFSRKVSGWSLKNATTTSSAFLPIHYLTIVPQFSITLYKLMTELLKKIVNELINLTTPEIVETPSGYNSDSHTFKVAESIGHSEMRQRGFESS